MPRKSADTLQEQRAQIKSKYKRGKAAGGSRIQSLDELSDVEIATKMTAACFLKAAGYSYSYIAEALDTTKKIVIDWFDDPELQSEVAKIQKDFVDGGIRLLKTYAIEAIEIIMTIARTADDKTALTAAIEILDRLGITKVNKSEAAITNKSEVDIVDQTGFLARITKAPPNVQQEAAQKMEDLFALVGEHGEEPA